MTCKVKDSVKKIVRYVNENSYFAFVKFKDFDFSKAVLDHPNDIKDIDTFNFIVPATPFYQSDKCLADNEGSHLRISISVPRCEIKLRNLYIQNISEIQEEITKVIFTEKEIRDSKVLMSTLYYDSISGTKGGDLNDKYFNFISDLIALYNKKNSNKLGKSILIDRDYNEADIINLNGLFCTGTSAQLKSFIVGLMPDNVNAVAASSMMGDLLDALVAMRDHNGLELSPLVIIDNLHLDKMVELSSNRDIEETSLAPIKKYLDKLTSFVDEDACEIHGYRAMQFTEILNFIGNLTRGGKGAVR